VLPTPVGCLWHLVSTSGGSRKEPAESSLYHQDQNSTLMYRTNLRAMRSSIRRLPQKTLAFPVISGFRRRETLSISVVTRIVLAPRHPSSAVAAGPSRTFGGPHRGLDLLGKNSQFEIACGDLVNGADERRRS